MKTPSEDKKLGRCATRKWRLAVLLLLVTPAAIAAAWYWALDPMLSFFSILHPASWTDADIVRHLWPIRLVQAEWVSKPPILFRWEIAETLARLTVVFLGWAACGALVLFSGRHRRAALFAGFVFCFSNHPSCLASVASDQYNEAFEKAGGDLVTFLNGLKDQDAVGQYTTESVLDPSYLEPGVLDNIAKKGGKLTGVEDLVKKRLDCVVYIAENSGMQPRDSAEAVATYLKNVKTFLPGIDHGLVADECVRLLGTRRENLIAVPLYYYAEFVGKKSWTLRKLSTAMRSSVSSVRFTFIQLPPPRPKPIPLLNCAGCG